MWMGYRYIIDNYILRCVVSYLVVHSMLSIAAAIAAGRRGAPLGRYKSVGAVRYDEAPLAGRCGGAGVADAKRPLPLFSSIFRPATCYSSSDDLISSRFDFGTGLRLNMGSKSGKTVDGGWRRWTEKMRSRERRNPGR